MYGEQAFDTFDTDEAYESRPAVHDAPACAGSEPIAAAPPEWQASLFATGDPEVDATFGGLRRLPLDDSSWIDHLPRWLSGSDHVFAELVARLPWRQRTVPMYERLVREPRLVWWWSEGEPSPPPLLVLDEVRRALTVRYERAFDSIGCNYYRTGADSVAWHGDRIRHSQVDPIVAIVSVGAPRPFQVRPRGGGSSLSFLLGQGDLLVMGGAAQHDWEHSVPKVAVAGPRISITFRHGAPPPSATVGGITTHPAAGAQNRHVAATGSPRETGTLGPEGRTAEVTHQRPRPGSAGPRTEGPPS
jgi:alkylated DNA repair dioxygenase AlkB